MKIIIQPNTALSGSARIPTSKSQSIRAILFATLAKGQSRVEHYLKSPDICAMIDACRKLGAVIDIHDEHLVITGIDGQPQQPDDIIDCGNSGQALRFIAALACLLDGYIVLTGDHSIRHNRPVLPVIESLRALGLDCQSMRGDDYAPLIIKGPSNKRSTTLSGEDSQPVSALLMALPFKSGVHTISVRNAGEKPWIGLTLQWLDRFNISYANKDFERYEIQGGQRIDGFNYTVPGDLSSLGYPLAAALVTQSELIIEGVDLNEPQGDKAIIDVAKQMGADISIDKTNKKIIVHPCKQLHGIHVNVNDFIDCITIIAVLGCYASGTTTIRGGEIARKKECDRINAIATELRKMGATISETDDGLIIQQSKLIGASIKSYHDHRIVMSTAIAALGASGQTVIEDTECVSKSFPGFAAFMHSLGAGISESGE